jgi:chaperonin GroEL (HSP60 family)
VANSHQQRDIETILNTDLTVRYGDEAWRQQVDSITAVADMVGTTFGPYGHDKLVVDNGGNVEVTSDTVSILRRLLIEDPIARMVRDVANSQFFSAGDGTTATVVLLGELVDHADMLVDQGLHPTTIISGYHQAVEIATDTLSTLAETYDITNEPECLRVAETVMSGTNLQAAPKALAPLVVDAITRVTDGYNVDLNALRVRTDRGRGIEASEFLSGAIIDAVPHKFENEAFGTSRILFLSGSVEPTDLRTDFEVSIATDEALDSLKQVETDSATKIRRQLQDIGAEVVVADGVSDSVRRELTAAGIPTVTSLSDADKRFLLRTLNTKSISDPLDATRSDLVAADVRFNHDENYTVFTSPNAKTATLHLYSTSEEQSQELENVFDKAIEVVTHVATDGRILPGGGAPEVAMAADIREQTPTVPGREQLAVYAFADALETLPGLLAQNAGLDRTDLVLALRSSHADNMDAGGIDVTAGEVANMWDKGVLDTFVTKKQMLSNVEQAAETLLRIDGMIQEPEDEPQSRTGPTV